MKCTILSLHRHSPNSSLATEHGLCRTINEVRVTEDSLAWEEAEGLEGRYANCFRVGYNRFELVLDFGQVSESDRVRLHSRVVTNPRSAKALHNALLQSIQEYESSFGPIEETPEHDGNHPP